MLHGASTLVIRVPPPPSSIFARWTHVLLRPRPSSSHMIHLRPHVLLRLRPLIALLLRRPHRGSRPPRPRPLSIVARSTRTSALHDIMNCGIFHACAVSFLSPAQAHSSTAPDAPPPALEPRDAVMPPPTTPASRASRWWSNRQRSCPRHPPPR
jgi:hypothetical protein